MNILKPVKDTVADFLHTHTHADEVPGCRGLRLHTASSFTATWEAAETAGVSAGPPYWAIPWVGGQALARYLLAYPETVAGRSVLDVGTGGGVCAIAAALAGAPRVQAADVDPMALSALAANAALNGVEVEPLAGDLPSVDGGDWEVILGADLWYERFLAGRVTAWFAKQARGGRRVFLGDRGRAYFPRRSAKALEWFRVEDIADTEAGAGTLVASAAWEMGSVGVASNLDM
jgi:predicted nicotinamide N-methyase